MVSDGQELRDLAGLTVPASGSLRETGSQLDPYVLVDPAGMPVGAVAAFFRDLLAAGRSAATVRSYGMDLLRWFRPCGRPGWRGIRQRGVRLATSAGGCRSPASRGGLAGVVRWRPPPARPYAASVRAHSETVLRGFYDFHLAAGSGPIMNPFPLDRVRRAGVLTLITTRWSRIVTDGPGFTGPGCRGGSRGASRTRCSTRSSPVCPRTGTGRWWRSTSRPVPGHRNCCRLPRVAWTRGAADRRDPQGKPRAAGTTGFDGCVRVAEALPGADGRTGPARAPPAVVVDAAGAGASADLSRRSPHVRTRCCPGGQRGDAARAAAYRGLPDGEGPGAAADRCRCSSSSGMPCCPPRRPT